MGKNKKERETTISREKQKMKEEVAKELGLEEELAKKGWSGLSSRQTGKIGAQVAKRLKKK